VHELAPGPEKVLAMHLVHDAAFAALKVPAAH
jgi:hypothetical protein